MYFRLNVVEVIFRGQNILMRTFDPILPSLGNYVDSPTKTLFRVNVFVWYII